MENYVTIELMGGLGNQLFQIFTVVAYGKEHNKRYVFDTSKNEVIHAARRRTYWDTLFKDQFSPLPNKSFKLVKEKRFAYDPLCSLDGDIKLRGYFQSFKYFDDIRDLVQSIVFSNKELVLEVDNFLRPYEGCVKVGLHIRRGDYLKFPLIHRDVGWCYFKEALEEFKNEKGLQLFVFSDDIEFAKHRNYPIKPVFVDWGREELDFLTLAKMDHFIIPNSTFSLWAAYLGQNRNKRVIAPKEWFGPRGPRDYNDIYFKECTLK